MAETLRTFTEAMNGLPDNTAQLISPQDVREALISLLPDRGQVIGDPGLAPWTVPIPAVDVWVDIPSQIDAVFADGLFWRMNGNGALVYNYGADWPSVVVPSGYTREVQLLGVVSIDPGNETWEFAFTIGGVIQLPTFIVDSVSTVDELQIPIISGDPVDVFAAPPISISVRNRTNANDLPLRLFAMRAAGGVKV